MNAIKIAQGHDAPLKFFRDWAGDIQKLQRILDFLGKNLLGHGIGKLVDLKAASPSFGKISVGFVDFLLLAKNQTAMEEDLARFVGICFQVILVA